MKMSSYGNDLSMVALEDDSRVRHMTIANSIAYRVAKTFDAHRRKCTECGRLFSMRRVEIE
ncbi:hypothetical protein G3O00_06910 [Burkholderia sp. Ac-20384]|uniref:hypothetical protein n=1 Tax=Burkholderia sp. Ac-20384 TaxID=2703902 RepID=UPI00197D3816|nr:hypothetical protein [Burkholderia sp. Ac-20384]MBN3823347.1 hypothetical protein [Burkholderia sp. Ac-20384]